ncbi:MAG: tRNA (guanosine(37)-N1)-methyltransferase TrmD [Patescibacteria group bacterium]|nr:tRNA (guanosine(37)-N1)-methyltransferase TrmD [Patescibacteria group bacterium]
MNFQIITIFPEILDSYFNEGMVRRAIGKKIIKIKAHNLRDWTEDKHRSVDDSPYGGGAGMVMKAEPIVKALKALTKTKNKKACPRTRDAAREKTKIVLLSAKGKRWNQAMARKFAKLDEVIFICGRYEGVDERVLNFVDEEISIGDYVLTGGELGAAVMIDSITRLLPGVLGNAESAISESHSAEGVLEYPQYTRPEVLTIGQKSYRVPRVLLQGDHQKIRAWREKNSKQKERKE